MFSVLFVHFGIRIVVDSVVVVVVYAIFYNSPICVYLYSHWSVCVLFFFIVQFGIDAFCAPFFFFLFLFGSIYKILFFGVVFLFAILWSRRDETKTITFYIFVSLIIWDSFLHDCLKITSCVGWSRMHVMRWRFFHITRLKSLFPVSAIIAATYRTESTYPDKVHLFSFLK